MLETRLRGRGDESGSAHVLVFSGVELGGLAACESRLERHGIAIDDRTQNTLFFRDPDGHRVGLSDFTLPQ